MTNHLILHEHPFAAYCWKPLIALYELELPFERHVVTDEASRQELAKIWPLAKIPVLVDETAGMVLPESTTIIEYLDALADGALVPANAADALQARLWDRFHDQYVANPMQKIVGDNLRPEGGEDPEGVAEARRTLDTAYPVLDAQLARIPWTAGATFTVADCAAAPALFYARAIHRWDETNHPNINRYYRELVNRPSVARVIDEARPYRELFPMSWPADIDVV
ncbi:glutathione S-transferase family protein [Baekduia sp.]|jgi:glutathione S-transferase|uniref:glutathione S-transferase family protein n=1 Tax=Baekduia sp. TaxID=2600305 RepID=UPI002E03F53A|nr:glutathione S-transferase family protein [Baekduia sp.]